MDPNAPPTLDLLLPLLPPQVRAWVSLALQLLTLIVLVLTALIPLAERIVRLTSSKKDDQILEGVRSVLSVFPRVVIPRFSLRPPAAGAQKPPAAPPVVLKPDPSDTELP